MGRVHRFRKEFAGCTNTAIRPKKDERPNRVATSGTRPDASGRPRIACLFEERNMPTGTYDRRKLLPLKILAVLVIAAGCGGTHGQSLSKLPTSPELATLAGGFVFASG